MNDSMKRRSFLVSLAAYAAPVLLGAQRATGLWAAEINVRDFGARGDGVSDDTLALQRAVDSIASSGGVVSFPPGRYIVDPGIGLTLRSNVSLTLHSDAIIAALQQSLPAGAIVHGTDVSAVTIVGGAIEGNRLRREPSEPPRGMGIDLRGCTNIRVTNVTISKCGADAVYVAASRTTANSPWIHSSEILVDNCRFTANRRQGISLVGATKVRVERCSFSDTGPARPGAGIDIEPNPGRSVTEVQISDCEFLRNTGYGIRMGGKSIRQVSALRNTIRECGFGGILVSEASDVELIQNTIDVVRNPVLIRRGAVDVRVERTTCRSGQEIAVERGSAVRFTANQCASPS